ncbi:MAG TPA: protein kinase [Polyangiaceae bacterium]|jgi:serine/threonine protein kinase
MASPANEADLEIGKLAGTEVAGKYRVDRLIGRGGMGAVFQATNIGIGKRVALKFLDAEAARNREAYLRFEREAQAAGMVESAHIVQIFDSGATESGLPFLVMELLTGEDLRARLRREKRLPVASALKIASQVLRALVRAHAAGIVHRDLKPDNVFLCARDDDDSFVKIVDFGISKLARARVADTLTRQGTVLGTAFYMSPEQAESAKDIDGRSDLFSVGAILFEMLVGRPPHVAGTYEAVLIAICTREADDVRLHVPEITAGIAAIVKKALTRDRSLRFQSAEAFLQALANPAEYDEGPVASAVDDSTLAGRTRNGTASARGRYGTFVAGTVATLSGFALTAYFMSKAHPTPTTPIAPSSPGTSIAAKANEPVPATPDVAPSTLPAPSNVGALAAHERPHLKTTASHSATNSPLTSANASPPPTTTASASFPSSVPSAHASPTPKPSGAVAHGLQLSTREP